MNKWSVYMIRSKDDSLYTGISTDVPRRFAEHASQGKKCAKYLRGKAPLELVYHAEIGSRAEASVMEHKLKQLKKNEKENFILDR